MGPLPDLYMKVKLDFLCHYDQWSILFKYAVTVSILLISYSPLLYSSTSFLNIPQKLSEWSSQSQFSRVIGEIYVFLHQKSVISARIYLQLNVTHMWSSYENLFTFYKECSECEKPAMYWQHKSKGLPVLSLKITQCILHFHFNCT